MFTDSSSRSILVVIMMQKRFRKIDIPSYLIVLETSTDVNKNENTFSRQMHVCSRIKCPVAIFRLYLIYVATFDLTVHFPVIREIVTRWKQQKSKRRVEQRTYIRFQPGNWLRRTGSVCMFP